MKQFISLLLAWVVVSATAQERILEFNSNIVVNADRSVNVTETIKVNAEGINIQRGIFRDIITTMRNEKDKRIKLPIEVVSVQMDGAPENYALERDGIYTRIRIGRAEVYVSHGEHTYTIEYVLGNQVRFFDNYDEIYWNVTGNQWQFAIEKASGSVQLPQDAVIAQHTGYSGFEGDTGCNCTANEVAANLIRYETTKPLSPYEGLTIAVNWQKGIIAGPTEAEIEHEQYSQQKPLYYALAGLFVVFLYLIIAWFFVGRDPETGAIIPRFTPPAGYGPAACRYVLQMGFDKQAFTAAIINMAVKGHLQIDKNGKHFKIVKITDDEHMLTSAEKKVAKALFTGGKTITLDGSYNSKLANAVSALTEQLQTEFRKINFQKNWGWMIPAIVLAIGAAFLTLRELIEVDTEQFAVVTVCGAILLFVVPICWAGISKLRKPGSISDKLGGLVPIVFVTLFFGMPTLFLKDFLVESDLLMLALPYIAVMLGLIVLCAYFFYLIQAPTVSGRKRMDEIEGLKMFMKVAEQDRLNMLNPPEKTPQLFEQLLPYAIALNVENEWSKKFDAIISRAIENNEYEPKWYSGSSAFHTSAISASLASSFTSSISSTSTPPSSSSSGSGGGGSSGGGGGGGGGGGW